MTSPWLRLLLPILSGAILVFAFPRWDFEYSVWLWMLPLLAVLWGRSPQITKGQEVKPARVRGGFWPAYLAGLAFFMPNLVWIRHSSRIVALAQIQRETGTPMQGDMWAGWGGELMGAGAVIGLSAYCAVYFGLWGWFTTRFARPDLDKITKGDWQASTFESLRCAFLAAAAWVACEWLRSTTVFTGFGWNGLGVAMHRNTTLIQAADLIGVMGLSFLPVFISCTGHITLVRMVRLYQGTGTCRTRLDFTFALVVLLAFAGYGMMKTLERAPSDEEVAKVRTVLVQPNVSQLDAWSGRVSAETYERLYKLTQLYAEARHGESHVDLVIWPESALPVHLYGRPEQYDLPAHEPYFDSILGLGDFSLLTGTEIYPPGSGPGEGHVSAILFRGRYSRRQQYDKVHLVPFGEYLPFRDIPPFSFLQGVLPGDFAPGLAADPLKLAKPEVDIIPLICFEDTVGRVARRFVRPGPQMIVNISNDGWFLHSAETEVHLANAKFRAIELRRPMCRATNTGVTCFIDTFGSVKSSLTDRETGRSFLEGCLQGEVRIPLRAEMTLYARHGDWFALLMLALCALTLCFTLLKKRRPRRA